MNSRQLGYFRTIVECASLTQAARKLGVTQPALSKVVRVMEQEVGVPLLQRSSGGVRATTAGRRLFDHARAVMTELQIASDDLRRISRSTKPILSVGALPSLMTGVITPAVHAWRKEFPDQPISIVEKSHAELMVSLEYGQIDVAIGRVEARAANARFTQTRLFRDRFSIVARAGHPLGGNKSVTIDELGQYPWICWSFPRLNGPLIEQLFKRAGAPVPPTSTESSCMSFLIASIRRSDTLAILPRHTVIDGIEDGVLQTLAFSSPLFEREIAAHHASSSTWPADRAVPARSLAAHVANVGLRVTLPLAQRGRRMG
jgi:LysR family transcriptional regulator of gallate degradation